MQHSAAILVSEIFYYSAMLHKGSAASSAALVNCRKNMEVNASNTRNSEGKPQNHEVLLSQASVGDLSVKITHFRASGREYPTNKSCAENISIYIYIYIYI